MHSFIALFCRGICFVISPTQAFLSWWEKSILSSARNYRSDLIALSNIPAYLTSTLSTEHCMTKNSCSTTSATYLRCLCMCASQCVCVDSSVASRAWGSCKNTNLVVHEAPLPSLSLILSLCSSLIGRSIAFIPCIKIKVLQSVLEGVFRSFAQVNVAKPHCKNTWLQVKVH